MVTASSMDEIGNERRGGWRVPAIHPLKLRRSGEHFQTYSTDLSATGLFARTALDIPAGEKLHLEIELPPTEGQGQDASPRRVVVTGRVARHLSFQAAARKGYLPGLGIRFEEFHEGLDYLWDYMAERSRQTTPSKEEGEQSEVSQTPPALPAFWGRDPTIDEVGRLIYIREKSTFVIEAANPAPPGTHIYLWFQVPGPTGPEPVRATSDVLGLAAFEDLGFACMTLGAQFSTRENQQVQQYFGTEPAVVRRMDTASQKDLTSILAQAMEQAETPATATLAKAKIRGGRRLLVSATLGAIGALIAALIIAALFS